MRHPLALASAALLLASCGTAPKPPTDRTDDVTPSTRPHTLPTADVEVGEPAPLVERSQVIGSLTVTKLEVGGDERGPWLAATVRVQNDSARDAVFHSLVLECKGAPEPGTPVAGDFEPVRPRSHRTENQKLAMPGDMRTGEPVPDCKLPAFATFAAIGDTEERDPRSRIRIPEDLVSELNAKRVR